MPKIISYTVPWLSRPAPGSSVFTDSTPEPQASPSKRSAQLDGTNGDAQYYGPRRLIAQRGTEIFTVVGNKIRWVDLAVVKSNWEEHNQSRKTEGNNGAVNGEQHVAAFRLLSAPVYYPIRQLVISPSGIFLAICTEYTVHIAVLPDPSRVTEQDDSPLKLKTYQLGPTTHVIPESPLVSGLWHPLSTSTDTTDCFVTITAESAVRVWELDKGNRQSFERPALAIDLKKLADGVSCDEDFEPSGFGQNKGFSADAFDMEASAACFAGQGLEDEDAWSAMTLWVAMRNGDVYALCPLLPTKWRPTSTTTPSLSTSVVSKMATIEDDLVSPEERQAVQQQYEWVQDLDNDEPLEFLAPNGEEQYEVRIRPANPSAIPRLQGPFEFEDCDNLTDMDVTDIAVIAGRVDEEAFLSGEDGYADMWEKQEGLPFAIVCLATSDRHVHIAMDMEGITGQWLPKQGHNTFSVPISETKELTFLDTIRCRGTREDTNFDWPMFTPGLSSRYNLLLTTSTQINSLSLSTWSTRLSADLSTTEDTRAGLELRLRLACQSPICVDEELLNISNPSTSQAPAPAADDMFSAPVVLDDINLGHMLLTATPSQAYSLTFDTPNSTTNDFFPSQSLNQSHTSFAAAFNLSSVLNSPPRPPSPPQRSAFVPPTSLYTSPTAPITALLTSPDLSIRTRTTIKQPIRLSPATLELMASTHRVLSTQTCGIETAVASLFRHIASLREELGDQVKQMAELADRLQQIAAADDERRSAEERVARAKEKQNELTGRFEDLRRKTARATNLTRDLSGKERGWVGEVKDLAQVVGVDQDEEGSEEVETKGVLRERFEQVKSLTLDLLDESERITNTKITTGDEKPSKKDEKKQPQQKGEEGKSIMTTSRQNRHIADALAMVERESAVIAAVRGRLGRLAC